MNDQNNNKSGGIGFGGLLTIVFITLKLCNVISWSWWLVLSPIWIAFGLVFGVVAIVSIILGLIALIEVLVKGFKGIKR